MTVKQRILTIRLAEKAKHDPKYAKRLEIVVICGERKEQEEHK